MPSPASADDWAAWASVPWTPVADTKASPDTKTDDTDDTNTTDGSPIIGWRKTGVPYLPPRQAVSLQTLDVWIPHEPSTSSTPDQSTLPSLPGTWIVYIHGGAWRDPAIAAASFAPTATRLLQRAAANPPANPPARLAGLASLNYRLSPHPNHPAPADPARQARHPDHIADVLAALSFLQRLLGTPAAGGTAQTEWVLAGHSCGATLAFQAVASPARWGLSPAGPPGSQPGSAAPLARKPAAIVGFSGLYDLAGFLAAPPPDYAWLRGGYREFVAGAFGEDEAVWRAVCPAREDARGFVGGWVGEWVGDDAGEGEKAVVVLVQSRGDSLVPWRQAEVMQRCWEGDGRVEVRVLEAEGDHDEIWRDGARMAEVLWDVAGEV